MPWGKSGIEHRSNALEADALNTRPVRRCLQVFKVFYVAWSYQLSDVDCDGVGCAS